MFEQEKARQSSPTPAASGRPLPDDTPVTTRPNSLREKSDDEKSGDGPENLDDRVLDGEPEHPPTVPDSQGRRELKEWECWDKLAYTWPKWKKAMYLSSIAGIQISMNFNTSVYPSAVNPLVDHFGISDQQARVGQMIYLLMYSFGCELWAPWSEEFGRWPILQLSLFFINIWQIPASVAPNYATIIVARALVSALDRLSVIERLMVFRAVSQLLEAVLPSGLLRICTNQTHNIGHYASSYCPRPSAPVLVESSAARSKST